MVMQSETYNEDVCLTQEFLKHLSKQAQNVEWLIQATKNGQVDETGQKGSIMLWRILMLRTKMLKCFVIQKYSVIHIM